MIVVDASALLEVLFGGPRGARVRQRLLVRDEVLHAPHLIDLEVAHVFRRNVLAGRLSGERGFEALQELGNLPLIRHPHYHFLTRIWELRENVTAYDAAYLALAESLDAPLVTCDAALASFTGHAAKVELI